MKISKKKNTCKFLILLLIITIKGAPEIIVGYIIFRYSIATTDQIQELSKVCYLCVWIVYDSYYIDIK